MIARALIIGAALAGCSGPDYVHVFVQGSDFELFSAASTDVTVHLYGAGTASSFTYDGRFEQTPDRGFASDFVVAFGDLDGDLVDLRVSVPVGSGWGGDALLALPGGGRDLDILLSRAEMPLAPTSIDPTQVTRPEVSSSSIAAHGSGLLVAWVDVTGVRVRLETNADLPIARPQYLADDPEASWVRVASRPIGDAPVVTAAAVLWRRGDGRFALARIPRVTTIPPAEEPIDLDVVDDAWPVQAAEGEAFDVAAITAVGGETAAVAFDASGNVIWSSSSVSGTAILAATAIDGGVAWAVTRSGGSSIALARPFDEPCQSGPCELPLDGIVRALAVSGDGNLVAAIDSSGQLAIATYSTEDLSPVGEAIVVADEALVRNTEQLRIGLDRCAVVWPELRIDNSGAVDLRYRSLDEHGAPIGDTHLINTEVDGNHYLPTAVCLSATRAYVSMFRDSGATYQLELRHLLVPDG